MHACFVFLWNNDNKHHLHEAVLYNLCSHQALADSLLLLGSDTICAVTKRWLTAYSCWGVTQSVQSPSTGWQPTPAEEWHNLCSHQALADSLLLLRSDTICAVAKHWLTAYSCWGVTQSVQSPSAGWQPTPAEEWHNLCSRQALADSLLLLRSNTICAVAKHWLTAYSCWGVTQSVQSPSTGWQPTPAGEWHNLCSRQALADSLLLLRSNTICAVAKHWLTTYSCWGVTQSVQSPSTGWQPTPAEEWHNLCSRQALADSLLLLGSDTICAVAKHWLTAYSCWGVTQSVQSPSTGWQPTPAEE